jgi:hypothetical protein
MQNDLVFPLHFYSMNIIYLLMITDSYRFSMAFKPRVQNILSFLTRLLLQTADLVSH